MKRGLGAVVGVCLAALSLGAASAGAAPGRLEIGMYCGPPQQYATAAVYRQAAAAGFTFSLPPCEDAAPAGNRERIANNRARLAAAASAGMTAFVWDERIAYSMTGPDAAAKLDGVIADYAGAPGFGGYMLFPDEPDTSFFAGLGDVVAYLRAHDPAHPALVNVVPNYDPKFTPTYLDELATTVNPSIFVYDHYPELRSGERPQFYANLAAMRDLSLRYSRPFWQGGQLSDHICPGPGSPPAGYRRPTEGEKRYQVFQGLAYGASGALYYTYWSLVGPAAVQQCYGPGVIEADGTPTSQYAEVRRINARAQAIGRYLMTARSKDVFNHPRSAGTPSPRRRGTEVRIPGTAPLTVGVFESDDYRFMLITSRDATMPVTTDADLTFGAARPEKLDPATDTWSTARGTVVGAAVRTRVTLAPGDGALYRVAKPKPFCGPGEMFQRVRAGSVPWARPCSTG